MSEDSSWLQFSKVLDSTSDPPYPYIIIEPVLDISQPFMTFLMWSVLAAVTIPAAIYDWWQTTMYNAQCETTYGKDWKAFSVFASTGRNDMMKMFSSERRPCYNPTQCGLIRVQNDNQADTSVNNYYLNYVYNPNADKSINPAAGEVITAIPMDGAKWVSGLKYEWTQILSEAKITAGWYVSDMPMLTSDGVNGVEPKLMWDVSRAYCTGYVNCEDLQGTDVACMYYLTKSQD